jgi:hypothetical protein
VTAKAPAKRAVPKIAREAFPMPDGGEVYVRALRLNERLKLRAQLVALKPKDADESTEYMVPRLLGVSVVDAGGAPVFTVEEWCDYGATYPGAALGLFNRACDLSGFSAEVAQKNSKASRS